ncbi:MAG: hypothetical protein AAF682_02990 [Planctomycetota bacterium]
MQQARLAGLATCVVTAVLAVGTESTAQVTQQPVAKRAALVSDGYTRMLDPKIGGSTDVSFHLEPAGTSLAAKAEVLSGGSVVATLWTGNLTGGAAATTVTWDGTDTGGGFVDTGAYTIRVSGQAGGSTPLDLPVNVVRLGVTEIEFQDSAAGNDEWQMVYFKKNTLDGVFYATPAIHEYAALKKSGEVSDLDLDDGNPRSAVVGHTATDQPVMNGTQYETQQYNYPLAYLAGASPRLEVTFGDTATSASGAAMGTGLPVAGYDVRVVATFSTGGSDTAGPLVPGGELVLDGDPLPNDVGRYGVGVVWTWQYAPTGTDEWADIAGSFGTSHRFYTLLGSPKWKAGASGTQYTGPWVEVADYLASWKNTLGLDTSDASGLVETFVKGFVGQNGGLTEPIEDVLYDAYPLGGDGGATHYFNWGTWNMDLSALLNNTAKGTYVNCTDNMGSSTTMLSMLGLSNVRPVRLGSMTLKAIWGIGAPSYTTALWGSAHSFSYHHIVTRDNGVTVLDTCMQLDEDGNPGATPGTPGWNTDRPWAGPGGYDDLSAYNTVSTSLENLPGLN